MLYSLQTTTGKAYIYFLIEHQSRPMKLMAFRLLRYSVAAMHRHLEQGNETLPVIIPLLFYHGKKSPYPYSMHWLDCFADRPLAESVYMQAFPLIDVTIIPDEHILTHRRVALLEIVQKHIRTRDMLELVGELACLLEQWQISQEQCKTLIYYLAEAGNTVDAEAFIRQLAQQAPPHYREGMMTIAEQLEAKGLQKGRQEGLQEGLQKGLQEGILKGEKKASLKIAQHMLSSGIAREAVKQFTGLSDADLNELS